MASAWFVQVGDEREKTSRRSRKWIRSSRSGTNIRGVIGRRRGRRRRRRRRKKGQE